MSAPFHSLAGRRVLVLGAGVAGLAAATALARRGASAAVLEQAPVITEVGAGLQISPNGVRVLQALGIAPPGDRAEAVELRDQRGKPVLRMALPQTPGFFLCHRADLIAALEQAARAAGANLQLLQRVASISLEGSVAQVSTAVGASHSAPLVIGADGLHSRLRGLLNEPAPAFFTGQVAWRAVIEGDGGPPVAQVFMGPGRHLVSYPLRGGRQRNIVAVEERGGWVEESWTLQDEPQALRAAFAGFGGPVPGWLEQVRAPYLWGLFRHPVAARWHDGQGRAALLGDAAHPTLPFMAQGANMALEDAWCLAQALAGQPDDPAQALADYQDARAQRCRALVAAANGNARSYHLRPPLAGLAHAALRLAGAVAPGLPLRRFGWIYDHDVTG